MTTLMGCDELAVFLHEQFPQVAQDFVIDAVTDDGITMRLATSDRHLRPGGTVSGPAMFALADVGVYLAILSRLGPVALAVTTNCSIDFLRKPQAGQDLVAEVRILKLGKSLAVADVLMRSGGAADIVARASLTYAIPPRKG